MMKKIVVLLIVLAALIGVASAQCSCVNDNCQTCDLPSYANFKVTSQVQGDGLVIADRDVKMPSPHDFCGDNKTCCVDANGNPGQQLKMHTHGTGNYEETSDVTYNLDDNKAKLTVNESATMALAAASVPDAPEMGSISVSWKDDVCLKDYQIGAAMRERYYAAQQVTKTTKGTIESVASTTSEDGYGSMSLSADSSFNGWGHFGVLLTDGKTTYANVDEDYFGAYQMKKTASVKVPKSKACTPQGDWLSCDNPEEWVQEVVSKCPSCSDMASW